MKRVILFAVLILGSIGASSACCYPDYPYCTYYSNGPSYEDAYLYGSYPTWYYL